MEAKTLALLGRQLLGLIRNCRSILPEMFRDGELGVLTVLSAVPGKDNTDDRNRSGAAVLVPACVRVPAATLGINFP
jgi:hypothetical protein